ncbi:hypothetical protein [Deinococcus sp. 12RED42]|uniref:hypothetical protein n=1 Tax=Deinococcus sp. 12RED42 TaxID=2745872 RepID=UPI001E533389|nr:hypothetical protein [Deinococcus sp. 12RED42]MCD0166807.1 hypothetical protein [Deinococcus sp. 12RED42]
MKAGPSWPSFEHLRVRHAEQFAGIAPGHYGALKVKARRYVILRREDWERMRADAQAVQDLAAALDLLTLAANAAATHQDEVTFRMLNGASGMCMKTVGAFLERQRPALGGEGS